jgi:hypothetical protein
MLTLKNAYNKVCNAYCKAFELKHDVTFDYWVGGDVGEMCCFNEEYFVNFHELRYDIDNDVPSELFMKYHYESIDNPEININYKSFVLGLRHKDVIQSERNKELETCRDRTNETRNYLYNEIDKELSK